MTQGVTLADRAACKTGFVNVNSGCKLRHSVAARDQASAGLSNTQDQLTAQFLSRFSVTMAPILGYWNVRGVRYILKEGLWKFIYVVLTLIQLNLYKDIQVNSSCSSGQFCGRLDIASRTGGLNQHKKSLLNSFSLFYFISPRVARFMRLSITA